MTITKPHPTPRRVNFAGDIRDGGRDLAGQLMGPNLFGEWYVVDHVTYDAQADRSTAHLRFARTTDMPAAATR